MKKQTNEKTKNKVVSEDACVVITRRRIIEMLQEMEEQDISCKVLYGSLKKYEDDKSYQLHLNY